MTLHVHETAVVKLWLCRKVSLPLTTMLEKEEDAVCKLATRSHEIRYKAFLILFNEEFQAQFRSSAEFEFMLHF